MYYICKAEDEDIARQAFESFGLKINYSQGQRYLSGFIRRAGTKELWLVELVQKWVVAVQTLSVVAERYPQTEYAGFTFCLQNKWQYIQQVVANTAPFFAPLKEAIRIHLLPSFLGIPSTKIDGEYRQLLTHSVKMGGLAIRNPMEAAPRVHKASLAEICHLMVWVLIICAPQMPAWQLREINFKMKESSSSAGDAANLPWQDGINETVPLAHGFWFFRIS